MAKEFSRYQLWRYYEHKAYDAYVKGARALGLEPDPACGLDRTSGMRSFFRWPVKYSVYDGLFGGMNYHYFAWPGTFSPLGFPPEYVRLASRVITAHYLGSDRWKDVKDYLIQHSRWMDESLWRSRRRYLTQQVYGHKGMHAQHKGYQLPEPIPLSALVFEEFGVDPLTAARDFIYTKDELEDILHNGWYPEEIFQSVRSFGGYETDWRGVRVLVVDEDFAPRVPVSFLPADRAVASAIYSAIRFVDEVWENPDILDDVTSFVIYRRHDFGYDGGDFPIILPNFGFPWGMLFFYMTWYVLSKYFSGLRDIFLQSTTLAREVESSLLTYTLLPAVAPFRVHGSFYADARKRVLRKNYFYHAYRDLCGFKEYMDSFAAPGLFSAWRFIQEDIVMKAVDKTSRVYSAVRELMETVDALSHNWYLGFGYLVRSEGKYEFYFGDPLTGSSPRINFAYYMDVMGRDRMWFNYSSLPFFEFLRKFVFLVFEMWRRFGKEYLGALYAGDSSVHLNTFFGLRSPQFRDFPFEEYTDPSQFKDIPFHVVFNVGMTILPVVMYSDVLPFRTYYEKSILYSMRLMSRPVDLSSSEGGVVPRFTAYRWGLRPTYSLSSRVQVRSRGFAYSGEVFAIDENTAYTAWNSWYTGGMYLARFPFYDPSVFEFLVQYYQNVFGPLYFGVVDASGGKYLGFYDDSTVVFIPYSRAPAYFSEKRGGISPFALVLQGYYDHLFIWVARAFSLVHDRPLGRDILRSLYGVFGDVSVLKRFSRFLRGRAKVSFSRYLSELLSELQNGDSKEGGDGGSSS